MQSQNIIIQAPDNSKPGDIVEINIQGKAIRIQIPPNVYGGGMFEIPNPMIPQGAVIAQPVNMNSTSNGYGGYGSTPMSSAGMYGPQSVDAYGRPVVQQQVVYDAYGRPIAHTQVAYDAYGRPIVVNNQYQQRNNNNDGLLLGLCAALTCCFVFDF